MAKPAIENISSFRRIVLKVFVVWNLLKIFLDSVILLSYFK